MNATLYAMHSIQIILIVMLIAKFFFNVQKFYYFKKCDSLRSSLLKNVDIAFYKVGCNLHRSINHTVLFRYAHANSGHAVPG